MSLRTSRLTKVVSLAFAAGIFLFCCRPAPAEPKKSGQPLRSIGLRDLIVLALQNDPGLVAMRNNISVEEARKRAAVQWRDPELRLGIRKEDNDWLDELPRPGPGGRADGLDGSAPDRSNIVRVRFFVPKPWEMKALINKAAKEVDRANYQVTATERRVVLDVREQYEELQYLGKKLEVSRAPIAIIEKHVARERALLNAGGTFTLDQLSFEEIRIPGIKLGIAAAETELQAAKRALAARVGLADGSRIRVTDPLVRSGIDLEDADLDYLTLMAFAHRGEVGALKHERAVAEAKLDILKTKRIPWFSFIEPEYSQDVTVDDRSEDAYGVRVGVILPLFSRLGQDEQVVEARLAGYYASLKANQKNIANEVAEAFRSVKEAASYRARIKHAVAQHSQTIQKRAEALEASEDVAAQEQLRYDAEMERLKIQEHNLAADRLFNQSLIRLEKALGADLDRVFKVKYEPAAGAVARADPRSVAVPGAAAASPKPTSSALPIVNRGSANGDRKSLKSAEKPKRKGLFHFLKEQSNAKPSKKTNAAPGRRSSG